MIEANAWRPVCGGGQARAPGSPSSLGPLVIFLSLRDDKITLKPVVEGPNAPQEPELVEMIRAEVGHRGLALRRFDEAADRPEGDGILTREDGGAGPDAAAGRANALDHDL